MTIEHKNLPESQLHEVKGASTAKTRQVLVADGAGSTSFLTLDNFMGWWDYNDSTTAGSPIALTTPSTYYTLTNNGLGALTSTSYGLSGVKNIWNTSTNRLDFSGLSLGDTVDIRTDLSITTSTTNVVVNLDAEFAIGSGSEYDVNIAQAYYKSAGTYKLVGYRSIYIGNAITNNKPARFKAKSDSAGTTVVVNGWYIRVIKRSL